MSEAEPSPARRRAPGLGRGLSALLGDATPDAAQGDTLREIALRDIVAHPGQPRRHFDEDALDELAASIAARGVLQPIVVRQVGKGYQIVAGERRWRAASRAKLSTIPAVVRSFDEGATLEVALLENIQREQLNAVEEGEAYRRLIDEHGHSQDELAKLLHKSRSHIANLMRLAELPPEVRAMVADGRLSMGHARALIGTDDARALADEVVARALSVRATELLARRAKRPTPMRRPTAANDDLAQLERQLGDILGLKVVIANTGSGGSVSVSYATFDQLDLICSRLTGGASAATA